MPACFYALFYYKIYYKFISGLSSWVLPWSHPTISLCPRNCIKTIPIKSTSGTSIYLSSIYLFISLSIYAHIYINITMTYISDSWFYSNINMYYIKYIRYIHITKSNRQYWVFILFLINSNIGRSRFFGNTSLTSFPLLYQTVPFLSHWSPMSLEFR